MHVQHLPFYRSFINSAMLFSDFSMTIYNSRFVNLNRFLQFTMPGGRHAVHHASLLHKAGAGRVLRAVAAAATVPATAPLQAKVFARIVLRNLEQCPADAHT